MQTWWSFIPTRLRVRSFALRQQLEDEDGNLWPKVNVFVKRNGTVHHFWGSELMFEAFPGGDMRHVDSIWLLWNALDLTPGGRGESWYPKLNHED